MHDRLRQLRQLFHAQRKRVQVSIARFAQADIKERFVGALERRGRRQPGKLSHEPHKMHARHLGDERIALRHVADQRFDLICVAANVAIENARRAGRGRMKTEQGVNQRGLAGAVWSEQANRAPAQLTAQVLQNRPPAKANAEAV